MLVSAIYKGFTKSTFNVRFRAYGAYKSKGCGCGKGAIAPLPHPHPVFSNIGPLGNVDFKFPGRQNWRLELAKGIGCSHK
ncbi:hypothetical protein KSB_34160 [Ktedonobacter robiniae]|uniref:Uncharacterized protein n=1 Tax=Ktedonobacter robiniae TaxID=2778365 RepID=A0ABQ3UQB7_9CHLR|nr:hypothetical protein KSB_34160 [Ktedonobacter robiniae]